MVKMENMGEKGPKIAQGAAAADDSSQAEMLELTVLMPCLNEAETLETCIRKALNSLRQHNIRGEVLIADNGSTDGSQQIAERAGARVAHVAAKGYGNALMGGIQAARGRYVIMGDADDSYDFTNLMPFVEQLRLGYDLVMGNRFKGGIKPGAMPPLHRYLGNPVLTAIGRIFFSSPCGDFHCGLRGFSRAAAARMDLQTTGMEFASEMVIKATMLRMKVTEVPTTLSPDGRSRPPHLRSWRDGWRHLRFMLLYSPRWLFLLPGLVLIAAGVISGAMLLTSTRPNTSLYSAAAILIGFQSIFFAALAKVFTINEGLLPEDLRLKRFFDRVSLEVGIVAGLALIVAGLGGSVYAVQAWGHQAYGALDPNFTSRVVIPSVTALILGFQFVMNSFFLSVLGLGRKRSR